MPNLWGTAVALKWLPDPWLTPSPFIDTPPPYYHRPAHKPTEVPTALVWASYSWASRPAQPTSKAFWPLKIISIIFNFYLSPYYVLGTVRSILYMYMSFNVTTQ